jgi:16S rRNA (uracil1498-N3)-methyltransferase
VPLTLEQYHYLTRVMRTNRFFAFNDGIEYEAEIIGDGLSSIISSTGRADTSGKWTFCFAPIKRIEDLISGVVQMGAGRLQPVLTERTVARHINWNRMRKIVIENCEQSGRSSIPELLPPIPFSGLDKKDLIFGDERKVRNYGVRVANGNSKLFIGPEGGFSNAEFAALDSGGAVGVSLGKTILRAEVAAIALCAHFHET